MMRTLFFLLCASLPLCGCATRPKDAVFQTSTIDALLAGAYDGELSCRRLLRHGDFGIGTFDRLDGEMILLDGIVYQVKADGNVYRPDPALGTPFATVCFFKPKASFTVGTNVNFEELERLIDRAAPDQNLFCAVKATGRFKTMRTRSVPQQSKPYPPLREVTANQPEFPMEHVRGTIVGFRCPAYVKGVNVPGYHLHFINHERTRGGHVLSFELAEGEVEIDVLHRFFLVLPKDDKGFAEADLTRDRGEELRDVERGKRTP